MGRYFVGAYAAAPSGEGGSEAQDVEYYAALGDQEFVEGLELQFNGLLRDQSKAFRRGLKTQWSYVLTTIGGTMERRARDAAFGLASADEAGRRRALDYLRSARDAVRELNDRCGRPAVRAVEIHSAPRPVDGARQDAAAFARSLSELRSWDWEEARLAVEHCDAWVAGQAPEKGFMPLDAEITAVQDSLHTGSGETVIGVSLNWGRSAIEGRDPDTALQHLKAMHASGLLSGLMFSGATTDDPDFGHWADKHAPFSDAREGHQLLTAARLEACLREVRGTPLDFLGFKVRTAPVHLKPQERVALLRRQAQLLDTASAKEGSVD